MNFLNASIDSDWCSKVIFQEPSEALLMPCWDTSRPVSLYSLLERKSNCDMYIAHEAKGRDYAGSWVGEGKSGQCRCLSTLMGRVFVLGLVWTKLPDIHRTGVQNATMTLQFGIWIASPWGDLLPPSLLPSSSHSTSGWCPQPTANSLKAGDFQIVPPTSFPPALTLQDPAQCFAHIRVCNTNNLVFLF